MEMRLLDLHMYAASLFPFVFVLPLVLGRQQYAASATSSFCDLDHPCDADKLCVDGDCLCSEFYWGSYCQFGRKKFVLPSGIIFDGMSDYQVNSKFLYLVDSLRINATIELSLHFFATECNWDHMYIYDGRSVHDPLIAAFSGAIVAKTSPVGYRTVFTHSGAALIYFYSDANVTYAGFNISYRVETCNSGTSCSGHGLCIKLTTGFKCYCEDEWEGADCSMRRCCLEYGDLYDLKSSASICQKWLQGSGCLPKSEGRASHAAASSGSSMWVYGGYSFAPEHVNSLLRFDLITHSWEVIKLVPTSINSVQPAPRYGHSMVFYDNSLYVFGGTLSGSVTNELWRYNVNHRSWQVVNPFKQVPVAVTGHASVIVGDEMHVFLGYSPRNSFVPYVQVFNIATNVWERRNTTGALVYGRFGHTATFDVRTSYQFVYIFGGYLWQPGISCCILTNQLVIYDWTRASWSYAAPAETPSMLHAAGFLGRQLVVFGGNAYNGTAAGSATPKCYSRKIQLYDLDCNKWHSLDDSRFLDRQERYGHSMVTYNRTLYIFGGFDGTLKNDVFKLTTAGACGLYTEKSECLGASRLLSCNWNKKDNFCVPAEAIFPESEIERPPCDAVRVECEKQQSCSSCMQNGCYWCDQKCSSRSCSQANVTLRTSEICDAEFMRCNANSNCMTCHETPGCLWNSKTRNCTFQYSLNRSCADVSSCADLKTCGSCLELSVSCMWCQSQGLCVDVNAYTVNFPYGQCMEWTTNKDTCKAVDCDNQLISENCLSLPECGWCADTSGSGLGECMAGGETGPLHGLGCPQSRWHFMERPKCRCNGHSLCANDSVCLACSGNTVGEHCERCRVGFFGNPQMNGTCKACECNGHMLDCAADGVCVCDLKGAEGRNCERCQNEGIDVYTGNSTNGGMCYRELLVGYQYTLNITKSRKVGYSARPKQKDKAMQFDIKYVSGERGYMNLTITYASGKSTVVAEGLSLGEFSRKFSEKEYRFDDEPEFHVALYGISGHFACVITFNQPTSIFDLVYFLIMFLVCFCSLLIILIVLWKVKQRYDIYRYNREQQAEREVRASRPFKTVTLQLADHGSPVSKISPTMLALEQFSQGHLAIASVFIELPRSSDGTSPDGQCGLCIGSTLVSATSKWTLTHVQQKHKTNHRKKWVLKRSTAEAVPV